MSIGDMTKLYDYPTSQCLDLELSAARRGSFLLFIALASTAYTLWTRYVESAIFKKNTNSSPKYLETARQQV
jgi:hypothetical protein